jgi:hypothetical protein
LSEMRETQKEEIPAGEDAGAYPLYLIPQVLSREIHARGGTITAIVIRRSGRHNYQIMISDSAATP